MQAVDLIGWANNLGVQLDAAGDKLRFSPPEAAIPEFVNALRLHKAELLEALRKRAALSERLANGATWLTATWAALPLGQEPDARFDKAVGAWADLCESFYGEMGGQGCALGERGPCAPGAFIVCPFCLSADVAKRAPEGWTALFDADIAKACPRCGGRIFWAKGTVRQCVGCFLDGPVALAERR